MSAIPVGTYTTIGRPGGEYTEHRWSVIPRTDPSPDGYFWAHQFGYETATGSGYVGLQTKGTGIGGDGKCVVFSIGDANNAEHGDLDGVIFEADFDGAPGYSTRAPYEWQVGRTYEFTVTKTTADEDGQWWRCRIRDVDAGTPAQTVTSIRVPLAWGGLIYSTLAFSERYSGPTDACSDLQYSMADFVDFVSVKDGLDVAADSYVSTLADVEGGCPNSRVTDLPNGARHEMGIPASSEVTSGGWRIVVCNNDADLTPLDPPVHVGEVIAGSFSGRKPMSGAGVMSFALHSDDPLALQIVPERVVRFDQWDSELGDGGGFAEFFAAYPYRQKPQRVAKGGKGAHIITFECPGIASDYDSSTVLTRNGGAIPFGAKRAFDWRTPELSTDDWDAPDVRALQGDKTALPPDGRAGIPRSYPNPLARTLWPIAPVDGADAPGFAIFHNEFTLDAESIVRAYPLGDDDYDVAIASESVLQFTDKSATGYNPDFRPLRLAAGTYTVRALVENVNHPDIANNSGAFVISIARVTTASIYGADRVTEEWILTSASSGWKSIMGDPMPGFTFPHRFGILHDEATGRDELPGWTLDPGDAEWPVSTGNIYDVLSSLKDVLAKDVDEGWVEWRPPASSKTLQVYPSMGVVRGSEAALNAGESLVDLSAEDDFTPAATTVEVGWRGGYTRVGSGSRSVGLSTDAETLEEAIRLGEAELARLAPGAQRSITVQIDPVDRARTPGLGYDLGDHLPVKGTLERAAAFSWRINGRRIIWVPEFATPQEEETDRLQRAARRTLPGSLSGRSEAVAPTTPLQPASGTLGAEVLSWGVDSSLEDTLPPQALLAPGRVHHLRVIAGEHPPIGGNLIWYLQVNGIDVYGPFTLPQGPAISGIEEIDAMPQEWESAAVVIYGGPNIFFAPRIETGSGHGKLTFEATSSPFPS